MSISSFLSIIIPLYTLYPSLYPALSFFITVLSFEFEFPFFPSVFFFFFSFLPSFCFVH